MRWFDAPGFRQFAYGCLVLKGPIDGVQGTECMQMDGARDVSTSHHTSVGKRERVLSRREPAASLRCPDGLSCVLFRWTGINEEDHAIRLAQCMLDLGSSCQPPGLRARREARWDR